MAQKIQSLLLYLSLIWTVLFNYKMTFAFSVTVFEKGEAGYYCHKIPSLLLTTKSVLLAFAEARGKGGDSCDDFTGTDLVMKRSFDMGVTWSALEVIYSNSSDTESNVVGNAAPVQDRSTGRLWLPFCRNNEEVFVMYSDDEGLNWAKPLSLPHLVLDSWKWVGLGPPGSIQLSTGRLLIPGYHTTAWKGDGCVSKGHTIYSDNHGATWAIGSSDFGGPFFANECQAVELTNGSVLINARTLLTHRIQVRSDDGGITFSPAYVVPDLVEPLEGCEGSTIRDYQTGALYYSGSFSNKLIRQNMTVLRSFDEGLTWSVIVVVDPGATSYSAMQVLESVHLNSTAVISRTLGVLYERSNSMNVIFNPDEIVLYTLKI
jgi:sialidase-1